jgi:hypothetical protein
MKPKLLTEIHTIKTNKMRAICPRMIMGFREDKAPKFETMPLQEEIRTELRITTSNFAEVEHIPKVRELQRREMYQFLVGDIQNKVYSLLRSAYDLGDEQMINEVKELEEFLRYD